MHKFLHTVILSLLFSVNGMAQNVSEMFVKMPSEILPYMPEAQRKELVELKKMEPDTVVSTNSSLGKIELTRLTDDIITLKLSEHNTIEIGRISSDTLLVIKTYGAPLQESVCYLYSNVWEPIRTFDFSAFNFEGFEETTEFPLVSAYMTESPRELLLRLNIPVITQEDKEQLKNKNVQRNVNWDGSKFN